jgi:cytochrome c556
MTGIGPAQSSTKERNMKRKAVIAAVAGVAVLGVSVAAFGAKPEDAIKYRRGVMAAQAWNMGVMGAMVKGERPYDKAEFAQRAANVAALSKMALEGFQVPGAESGDTKAKPEAFTEMDKFKAGMDKLALETGRLSQVASSGDLDAIKAQFGEVGKQCKGCHDNYRSK